MYSFKRVAHYCCSSKWACQCVLRDSTSCLKVTGRGIYRCGVGKTTGNGNCVVVEEQ